MTAPPSFAGLAAAVLHRPDDNTQRLVRQLELLGARATVAFEPLGADAAADLVFVDADQGFDDLLPFSAADAPVPVIALLASEAPGRIAWALGRGAVAVIAKPIGSTAVYPALATAVTLFAERQAARARVAELEERLRLRPLVFAAARMVADRRRVSEDDAFRLIRRAAMARRLTLEQLAADVLAGRDPLSETG